MSVDSCKIIELPKISDPRGSLTFVENTSHFFFDIKRVYYLYDVPADSERGGHAHKRLQQLIIPLSGSFEIFLDDGIEKKSFFLSKPWQGLYICPMIWREISNFSSGAVSLVLASELYSEDDYFRNYSEFLHMSKKNE